MWAGCNRPDTYLKGVASLDNQKYDDAIAEFSQVIKQNPQHAEAFLRRAVALQKKGNPTKALADYTEAIRVDQELAEANRLPEAERTDAVRKGVPLGTSLVEAYLGRGSIYSAKADNEADLHDNEAALGDNDAALRDFTEAIRLDPKCAEGYHRRGAVFLAKELFDLALDDLTAAIQLAPDDGEALYQRSRAALRMGDCNQAIKDGRRAIQLKPAHARAFQQLGAAYLAASPPDCARAIACCEEAQRLDPSLAKEVQDDLAKARSQMGRNPDGAGKDTKAKDALDRAKSPDSSYSGPAEEHPTKVGQVDPNGLVFTTMKVKSVEKLNGNGWNALKNHQWDTAIKCFGDASRIDPHAAASHYGRGVAFLEKHDPDTAVVELDLAIAVKRDYAMAYCERARAYTALGQFGRASSDATEAIRLDPSSPHAHYNRAEAYLGNDDFELAFADLHEVVSLDRAWTGRVDATRAGAYRDRGLKRLKKEQWAPALDDLLASAGHEPTLEKQLRPQIAEAYRGRGLDYARAGESAKALSDLNEAVRLDGRNAKNYEARGRTYYKAAKWDLALADLTKAASLDPEIEYQLRGRIDEARRMLKESGG